MARVDSKFFQNDWLSEVPSGTVNGVNVTFTLAATPANPQDIEVYLDGLRKRITTDYTVSGSTITFVTAPALAQSVYVYYRKRN